MEKLDDMFVNGKYTPFAETSGQTQEGQTSESSQTQKHPLADSTNDGNPAKKRKILKTSSKPHKTRVTCTCACT